MRIKAYIYDAFTKDKFKGNQAAVIPFADGLGLEDMKNIAKEFNYSESVFLFESDKAIKKVRFFTPNSEVDLCGHATIAYITCLCDNKLLNLKTGKNIVNIETNLGILPVIVNFKNDKIENIMMYQAEAKIDEKINVDFSLIMEALGLSIDDDLAELKIVKAYTGLWDIMIHLKNKEKLYSIKADMEKIKEISKKLDIISFHPFALERDEKNNLLAYVRNFAPIVDIDEEAATGTSNGALAYFLYSKKYLNEAEYLRCIQGETMGRESEIIAQVLENRVLVGGFAVKTFEGELDI
ncbi:MAG: PhzF family phenazine biosynthesis protein [Fusobacterium sp.]|uniref:PhzF family phenazine biosynthesis protein n=1 Tax=Fusobacterium sp. TaxID=68766 RepID=UPI0026DD239C|nr:PhzF family phenazine biosynthesis protein [Fusobacterium sp.]MDO4690960.1 PhzF family phenazine biosynthesis protein [Fusobacterium sp.]